MAPTQARSRMPTRARPAALIEQMRRQGAGPARMHRTPGTMREVPASRRGAGINLPGVGGLWSFLGFKWLFESIMNLAFRGQSERRIRRRPPSELHRVQPRGPEMTPQDRLDLTRGQGKFAQLRAQQGARAQQGRRVQQTRARKKAA